LRNALQAWQSAHMSFDSVRCGAHYEVILMLPSFNLA
jgi:hypothetical protein